MYFQTVYDDWQCRYYPELTKGLRINYDSYADIPGIAVFTLSRIYEKANGFLSNAVIKGVVTRQINNFSP